MRSDDRATTTSLAYVLLLGVATLLVSGLLVGVTTFVDGQTDRVTREGMEVTVQRAAGAVETADRLVDAVHDDDPDSVLVEQRLPRQIARSAYTIRVVGTPPDQRLRIRTATDEELTIRLNTRLPVERTSVQGGPLVVVYDPGPPAELEVRSDV